LSTIISDRSNDDRGYSSFDHSAANFSRSSSFVGDDDAYERDFSRNHADRSRSDDDVGAVLFVDGFG
jgi:hypothetical protein